jgi:hypothetical protein
MVRILNIVARQARYQQVRQEKWHLYKNKKSGCILENTTPDSFKIRDSIETLKVLSLLGKNVFYQFEFLSWDSDHFLKKTFSHCCRHNAKSPL